MAEELDKSTDVNVKDADIKKGLIIAAAADNWDLVEAIIEKGDVDIDDKDKYGITALMYAARHGELDIVEKLIDKGADIKAKNNDGETPLIFAARCGKWDIVLKLIDKGADIEDKDKYGQTALMFTITYGRCDILEKLIDRGANIEAKDNCGRTMLIAAALAGNGDIVEKLLNKGADTNVKDTFLRLTALESAVRDKKWEAVYSLLGKDEKAMYKLYLNDKEINELTGQILNLNDNDTNNTLKQQILFDIYSTLITSKIKHENFPLESFTNSIKESKSFLYNPYKINLDNLDNTDRFLVLPIFARQHCFSSVIRKNDNDKYSIYLINLGDSPEEKGDWKYKEYVLSKNDAVNFLKSNTSLNNKYKRVDWVYDDIKSKAIEEPHLQEYVINVDSRKQRLGNCFVINLYKGLNFITTTLLSAAENKDFTLESLRSKEGEPLKPEDIKQVKALRSIYRSHEKRELSTMEVKEELIKNLIEMFPQYKDNISGIWNKYKEHKEATRESKSHETGILSLH